MTKIELTEKLAKCSDQTQHDIGVLARMVRADNLQMAAQQFNAFAKARKWVAWEASAIKEYSLELAKLPRSQWPALVPLHGEILL